MNAPRIVMGAIVAMGTLGGILGAAAPAFGAEPRPSPLAGSATEAWHRGLIREEDRARRGARSWQRQTSAEYRQAQERLKAAPPTSALPQLDWRRGIGSAQAEHR